MTTAFKDFLHEKAQQHNEKVNAAKLDEWRHALDALFNQMRAWLKESDPDGVININEGETNIEEPGLGRYRVPYLELRAFGKWIAIIPKARQTIGRAHPPQKAAPELAHGRVDITDEIRRFVLYRFRNGKEDNWVIEGIDAAETAAPGPLDKEAFEKALMSYLR